MKIGIKDFKIIKSLFSDFIDIIFPSKCLTCNNFLIKGEEIFCLKCFIDISKPDLFLNYSNSYIAKKFYGKIIIKHCFSFQKFTKGNKIRSIIHYLKYKNKHKIGELLGNIYGKIILEIDYKKEFDIIIPIPLHKKKIDERGYNQAHFFAKGLSETLSIPSKKEYIIRKIHSKSQTKIPDELNRWKNVKNIFEIKDSDSIKNKNILLVDDVITSGSTLEACAQELLENGASSISIATIAYA